MTTNSNSLRKTAYGSDGSYDCAACDEAFTATVTLESADPSVGLSAGGFVEDASLEINLNGDLLCPCGAVILADDLIAIEAEDSAERWADYRAEMHDDY